MRHGSSRGSEPVLASEKNLVFADIIMRAEMSAFTKVAYLVEHELFHPAYMFSGDVERWRELREWLVQNCTGEFRQIGAHKIAFQTSDDAILFKMHYGGTLSEVDLGK